MSVFRFAKKNNPKVKEIKLMNNKKINVPLKSLMNLKKLNKILKSK